MPVVCEMVDTLAGIEIEGVPHRMVQNFAVPAAVYTIATHGESATAEEAETTLRAMLDGREMPEILQSRTEMELLDDILYARIPDGTCGTKFIGEIIETTCSLGTGTNSNQLLHQYGLKVVTPRGAGERSLFVAPKLVTQYLLKDTPWATMELEPILRQIRGTTRSQQRLNAPTGISATGNQIRGYLIPLSSIIGESDNTAALETE